MATISFKNASTGEVMNVTNIKLVAGRIFFSVRGKGCGQKFLNRNTCLVWDEDHPAGTWLKIAEGWEIVDAPKARAPRKPRASKVAVAEPQPEPVAEEPVVSTEPTTEPQPEPVAEEVEEPLVIGPIDTTYKEAKEALAALAEEEPTTAEPTTATVATALALGGASADKLKKSLSKKYGAMAEDILTAACTLLQGAIAGVTDELEVRKIATSVFAEYAKTEPVKAKLVAKTAHKSATKEYYCTDYEDIKQDVADGWHVYLFGAAGSGKTHTAEQIARDLGLDYYTQTTIQFAHDVRGYGDAGGRYIGTPFYEAFSKGGLYFQDEYDRSYAEAAIVLNTALANGYYDFPVVGRVKAHPNFRFMAAGNTKMKGADESYVTGQVIDASSRDRFGAFYECEYNHEVELNAIAKGDKETVKFVEDVRKAIEKCGITHIVSYRATAYMVERKKNMAKTLIRNTFKGLETDDVRMIYNALCDKDSKWAKAMATII